MKLSPFGGIEKKCGANGISSDSKRINLYSRMDVFIRGRKNK
jgi:hypothetical protein